MWLFRLEQELSDFEFTVGQVRRNDFVSLVLYAHLHRDLSAVSLRDYLTSASHGSPVAAFICIKGGWKCWH